MGSFAAFSCLHCMTMPRIPASFDRLLLQTAWSNLTRLERISERALCLLSTILKHKALTPLGTRRQAKTQPRRPVTERRESTLAWKTAISPEPTSIRRLVTGPAPLDPAWHGFALSRGHRFRRQRHAGTTLVKPLQCADDMLQPLPLRVQSLQRSTEAQVRTPFPHRPSHNRSAPARTRRLRRCPALRHSAIWEADSGRVS
jgi:hypothetical protein